LSQSPNQQFDELLATELETFEKIHDRPHIRQQRRVGQRELAQHPRWQAQFDILRQGLVGGRRLRVRGRRRLNLRGRGFAMTAGIEMFLLPLPRRRAIVGGTSLLRRLPAMVLSAAERTTQILAPGVPGMGQKANAAMTAGNGAAVPLGMGRKGSVQRDQILPDQRLGAVLLMPIRLKGEKLPDGDDKKAKLSVTLSRLLHTPSSYLTEAKAS